MKKVLKVVLCTLMFLALSVSVVAADSVYGQSEEQMLYDFYISSKSYFEPLGKPVEPAHAFLADIDNDFSPELLVFFSYIGPGGPTFSVYKNNNGVVEFDSYISTNSGTGIHHNLGLTMQDNGEMKVLDHYVFFPNLEIGEQYLKSQHYISGGTITEDYIFVQYYDKIYYTRNTDKSNPIYCTRQEVDEIFNNVYTELSENIVFSSDSDYSKIGFYDIWNRQKECRDKITVLVDNKEIIFDQPPIIVDNRALVPLRAIFEALEANVAWQGETKTVISTKGSTTITMTIGKSQMYKNGEPIILDVVPLLINDRTLVPVRAVAECFDCKVDWDGDSRTVIISSKSE